MTTGGTAVSYDTDARGLRQTRTDGATEDFLWSTARGLPVLVSDGSNYYLYGVGTAPIAQISKSSGTATYLHTDILGSIRLTTNAAGTTLGAQTFTEYGTRAWSTGTIGTEFGFTGNWTDPDTGLVHLRARDYDPQTGQFLSLDPAIETTKQPYAYAGNNPTQNTDPSGLLWGALCGGVAGFIAAALGFGGSVEICVGYSSGSNLIISSTASGFAGGGLIGDISAFGGVAGGLESTASEIAGRTCTATGGGSLEVGASFTTSGKCGEGFTSGELDISDGFQIGGFGGGGVTTTCVYAPFAPSVPYLGCGQNSPFNDGNLLAAKASSYETPSGEPCEVASVASSQRRLL